MKLAKRFAFLFLVCSLLASRTVRAQQTADELLTKSRAALAQISGRIAIPGLKEPVEVLRDRWGVPHIYAKNQDDLFFAQGFVAAQDRLFQMDMWRRIAVGETAEVLGKSSVIRDRLARLLQYRGDMQAEWAIYSPDAQRICTAFTAGINAYINLMGDRLPIEFQIVGYRPKKWQPADCLGRTSVLAVAQNLRNEVTRARLVAAVGAAKAQKILPTEPTVSLNPVEGLDLSAIDDTLLAGYKAITAAVEFAPDAGGSNNWAVDGSLSAFGKPLLASDPHRALALPSLRYVVHLNAPGWNVIGSGEPALPGVALGHNEKIAWGFTIVMTDQADLVIEQLNPANPNQYKVGDHWEDFRVLRETVAVKGTPPAELELRFSRNGPIIHEDLKRQQAFALRWVGSEPGAAAYLASLAIDRAENWDDFLLACGKWRTPAENMMYADVAGNIGWIAAAQTPVRKGYNGLLPVPGASEKYQWQGNLSVSELPQTKNPPEHFLATANHNILPPDYTREIGYDWSPPYRYERIRKQLSEKEQFNVDDFKRIQHDNVSIPGQQLSRLLQNVPKIEASLKPHVELLVNWDGRLTKKSAAGPIYGNWLRELSDGFYRMHVPAALVTDVADRSNISQMLAELQNPSHEWFGGHPKQARDKLIVETFAKALEKTKAALGDNSNQWEWGKLHHVLLKHPLHKLSDAHASAFNIGPVPSGSGPYTPDQARWDKNFARIHGATYRQVFDLSDWDLGQGTNMPGQSGQPGSPHYSDLLPLWSEGTYFPLAYSRKKVEEVTLNRLVLEPKK